jgi:nicotinamide N-methyltransferase
MPGGAIFAESYFGDAVVEAVREILGCEGDEVLVMELYNLLVRPDKDFALRWHRDDISAEANAEEEMKRLNEPSWHAQWNLALYDDYSLVVVPGSHRRARTDAEREADPFTKFMPEQKVVGMKAGDVVFYDNNILHRGVYDSNVERMTLHGSMGHVRGSSLRARNVLQHGVGEWVDKVDFADLQENTRKRAEGMRQRLVQLGRDSGDVGFSHPD